MPDEIDDSIKLADLEEDRIAKKGVVASALLAHLSQEENCNYEDTKVIGERLRSGKGKLVLTLLSGGYTNYTYKVSCIVTGGSSVDDKETTHMFVKLCFPRAFWNPNPTYVYDLDRIVNEVTMMEQFGELAPACVAKPFFLLDIDDMKLLACEWSSQADEQLVNQFIDGVADERVAINLAKAVAALHSSEIDVSFNTEARHCMIDIFPRFSRHMLKMAEGEPLNRAEKAAANLGKDRITDIWTKVEASYRATDIPIHADLHAFNILVEGKPDVSALERFGPDGCFVVCDWEMAMVGPLGLDIGRLYSIPVACIIAHALSGNDGVLTRFLEYCDVVWNAYSSEIKSSGGKDDIFLVRSYRNVVAWLSWKIFAMSVEEWFFKFLPFDSSDTASLKESLAVIAFKGLPFFDDEHMPDSSVDEIQCVLFSAIEEEVTHIKTAKAAVRTRAPTLLRSSLLRAQNRRVSDSFVSLLANDVKRASIIAGLE